jgi:hypothetical protein
MLGQFGQNSVALGTAIAWLCGASLELVGCGGADFTSAKSGAGGSSGATGKGGKGGSSGEATGGTGGGSGEATGGTDGSSGEASTGGTGTGGTGTGGTGTGGTATGGTGMGGTDGGKGGGASGSAGASVASCEGYINAYCAWAARCTEYVYGGSVEACESLSATSCEWNALPGIGWTDTTYGACADAYAQADCAPTESICELPAGTLKNGLECATSAQCESGYCVPKDGCGVCGPNPQHPLGGTCDSYANCEPDLDCVEQTCVERPKVGEACDDAHHCSTAGVREGYPYCVEGICTLVGLPGEPCYDTGSSTPLCGFGAACTTENVCVSQTLAEEGDVCGTFSDEVITCPLGTCVTDTEGDESHCMNWAGPGESCHKIPNFSRCATGLLCEDDLCVWGEPSEPPSDCGR